MDKIVHLTCSLLYEGGKLKPKIERVHSRNSKSKSSELENAVFHENKAPFRNLFFEGTRSIGTTNGIE